MISRTSKKPSPPSFAAGAAPHHRFLAAWLVGLLLGFAAAALAAGGAMSRGVGELRGVVAGGGSGASGQVGGSDGSAAGQGGQASARIAAAEKQRHGKYSAGASGTGGAKSATAGNSGTTAGTPATAAAVPGHAEPWELAPFTADPASVAHAASRFAGRDNEPVVVLLSEQRYILEADGRVTFTQRLVYRILTAAADTSWSTVERSWSPWHQSRPEVRARVITAEGVAHSLDPSVLTESGEVQEGPDMFGDGRVLRGPLPATGPGAVVEQEVTVHDTAPFFDAGIVEIAEIGTSVSLHHGRVVIEAPAAMPLRYVTRLLPNTPPREEQVGGPVPLRRLTFDFRELAADDDSERGLPPDVPRTPYLAFSTGRSWADIARRYSEIVDEAVRGADLSALIRAAGGPAASQLETMNRLLERLGEIRYTGVELGQGGIVPRSPAETLRRKFGDCKDKAVLLIAALRALDIPAYVALLNAGEDQQDVEQGLPGFGGFNHAIVVVPGSPSIWIDPTDRFARAGELPTDDQGRLALIASPTAIGLARTPEAAAAENRAVKTREFFLADQGAARAVETDEYWGAAERDLRAFYTAEDPEVLRESISDYLRKAYLAKDLAAYDHANPLDLSRPFHLHLEAQETKRAVTDEKGAAVAILPSALLEQLPDELTNQEHEQDKQHRTRLDDYYFSRPFTAETIYRIVPPPGFAPLPLPADRVLHLGPATLSEGYTAGTDGVVTATLRIDSGKRRISSEEFEQLRTGARNLAETKPVIVRFEQVGEADLAAGRLREAVDEFRREAAAAPKKALPHCRLARALLAGGLGEAAHLEVNRAIRLEPRSAVAQRTLGWVLEHDTVGRRFGPGFDRTGAITAYRKAKSLDPEDETARADLAILLEHDGRGRRYAAGADLAAAISEYQVLRGELKHKSMDDNLLIALLHAGRYAEMQALAADLDDTPARDTLRVLATAATAGPTAAVREAERRLGNAAALVAALDEAAEELVGMRRYGEAAALLARAAQQSPNAAAFLARSEALRRARRHEAEPPLAVAAAAVPASRAAVSNAAKRFLLASLVDPPAAERTLAMLSQGLSLALTPAARKALVEAPGRGLRKSPRQPELSADVQQDLVLAAWRDSVRGDDQLGYRVEVTSAVGETPARTALFVVPEHGEYRIAALGDVAATLGFEAQRRLAARDLRGARQWLDWASEELRQPSPVTGSAAAGGDADLPGLPLLTLWPPGEVPPESTETIAQSEAMRCAAASLAAIPAVPAFYQPEAPTAPSGGTGWGATPNRGEATLATLRGCRDAAGSEARRWALEKSVADALADLGRFGELLDATQRLAAARPDSVVVFTLQARALAALSRWGDLDQLAHRRLQNHPDDAAALRLAAGAASRRGDLETAATLLRRIADSGRETAGDLDRLAWLALVRGRPDDQAVEDAQRAVELSGSRDAAALHTLASLLAERGRPAEAYRVVLQAMEARPRDGRQAVTPDDADWYVLGKLAENYGLPEEARRLYARVRPGTTEEVEPLSTFRLARARLAALGTVTEAAASRAHDGRR